RQPTTHAWAMRVVALRSTTLKATCRRRRGSGWAGGGGLRTGPHILENASRYNRGRGTERVSPSVSRLHGHPWTSRTLTPQKYPPYRSLLLSPEELAELTTLSPAKVFVDVAFLWTQIFTAWIFAAALRSWWIYPLAAAFVGNRYYSLYIIGHDGLH